MFWSFSFTRAFSSFIRHEEHLPFSSLQQSRQLMGGMTAILLVAFTSLGAATPARGTGLSSIVSKVGAVKLTGSTTFSNGAGILVVALLSFPELLTVKSCRSIRVAGTAFPRVAVKQIIIPTNVKSQKKARDTANT